MEDGGAGPAGRLIETGTDFDHVIAVAAIHDVVAGPADQLIIAAVAVLIVSVLGAATAPAGNITMLVVGLFLLGVGWNFGFVAASTELQIGLPIADRLKIQGVADAITWISGGIGAAISGVILGASSFAVLAIIGAVFALAPIPFIVKTKPRD